jgi:hypothetical protein
MSVGVMKDLKTKSERSTRLEYTVLHGGLEHLKIEARFRGKTVESFSQDDASFRTALFMLYTIYRAVEVSLQYLQTILKGPPVLDVLVRARVLFKLDNPSTCSIH